ncbi:Clcn7 [Symbiodinium sp. CCMP2456]|nr:Clcn7 [Symbiodinium sp. CCMP2456]
MDPHLLILLLCLGLLLLAARAARRILYRACVPRSPALRRTSWRDLCLLRSDRLSDWPALEAAFETSRYHPCWWITRKSAFRILPKWKGIMWCGKAAPSLMHCSSTGSCRSMTFAFVHQCQDRWMQQKGLRRLGCRRQGSRSGRLHPRLWIEFVWPCCKSWTLMRTASVLLHEMVHVWHDSSWTRLDQLLTPHSATFLRMCADLNQMCQEEELPFFPNIFTESWVLLVADELGEFGVFCAGPQREGDFGHRWMNLLKRNGHFKGNLLGDLQELGISLLDAIAAKKLLNSVHIQQALHFGYDRLQSWRRFLAQACMQRVASTSSNSDDVIIRGDYVVARQAVLAQLAACGGVDASIVASPWTAWKKVLFILIVTVPHLHHEAVGMGIEEIRVVPVCGLCSCLALVIFTCVALPMSIKSMEQGRNSVQLQWMTQSILDEVITDPGLKFVGLGNYLIEFPATFNTMYFIQDGRGVAGASVPELFEPMLRGPIRARSADGLEMLVSVSFQWRLRSDALKDLYNILGETMYRDEFVRFARAAIIESCSLFTADQYFTERTTITAKMLEVLQSNFEKPELGLRMEITGLQLREVDLPDDYDDEIENTQEQMQEVEVGKAERQEQIIIKEAEKLVAIQQVEELLRAARGLARRVELQNEATITQLKLVQQKQAEANSAILQQFANETQAFDRLFEVMEIRALEDHDGEKMAVSL